MLESLEIVTYLATLIAFCLSTYVVVSFGKGMLNVLFLSFTFSIFFIGMYLLHGYLSDVGVYNLSEESHGLWVHLIVYLSMLSLIWGGYRIKSIVSSGAIEEGVGWKDARFYAVLLIALAAIFVYTPILEGALSVSPLLASLESWGFSHFTVFILGGISFWYLKYVRGSWGLIAKSISLVMGFLLLIGVQHLWENLTESWKVVSLSHSAIESVESIVLSLALVLFMLSQWKLIGFIRK